MHQSFAKMIVVNPLYSEHVVGAELTGLTTPV